MFCDDPWSGVVGVGGRFQRERMYVYIQVIHFVV